MKVTTDACIFGAWTPILPSVKKVLDIGTGTGLLSLMLLQRNKAIDILAVEIDEHTATQAKQNISNANWSNRINVICGDISKVELADKYDLIITNPPFFSNSLLSPNKQKNMAKHKSNFTNNMLNNVVDSCINTNGYLSIILPTNEYYIFETFMKQHGWESFNTLFIKHAENMPINRIIGLFRKNTSSLKMEDTLVIYNSDRTYSEGFSALMTDFYLNL